MPVFLVTWVSVVNRSQALPEIDESVCFHCGLVVPPGTQFSAVVLDESRQMCCAGCAAVAEAIVDAGQESFYQHRTDYAPQGSVLVPDFLSELEVYNHADIQKSFVIEKSDNVREATLFLEGITCAACVWLNEKHVASLPGVLSVQINYATHRASVVWNNEEIRLSDILGAIRSIGYSAHPYDPNQQHNLLQQERKTALRRIGVAGILGMQIMTLAVALYLGDAVGIDDQYRSLFNWFGLLIVIPILLYSGKPFFSGALRDLLNMRFGMDIPVALGLSIAFLGSAYATFTESGHVYYDSVAMFIFFLLTARFFEFRAREHSADVNERLTRITPATATRLNNNTGEFESVPVAELIAGDRVRVHAGDVIPADGVIYKGYSSVNEALLTGESLPRACGPNDKVIGGSVNEESPLFVDVQMVGQETVLSHMLRLMERAQTERPAVAQMANRIAGYFVVGILMVAITAGLYWYLSGSEKWLEIVISLLVVTCPCALSLATPAAMTASTGALAAQGMLVTRGNALETLSKVRDFAFDKTGTFSDGELKLRKIITLSDLDENQLLTLAAKIESGSEHLLGRAIVAEASERNLLSLERATMDLQNFPGLGIKAAIDGAEYYVGSDLFVEEEAEIVLDAELRFQMGVDGYSVVLMAVKGQVLGAFFLGDEVRSGAKELVSYLASNKIGAWLLTGDTKASAERVALQTGIGNVEFRLKPEQKLEKIISLQAGNSIVAMLGDGINDSPVLAGADVSIAMGSAAQLAKFNADIVLVNNSLVTLNQGLVHAKKTVKVVRQNLMWALLYNLVAIPAAALGYVAPWMAAIGMSLSSLIVVLNSTRLRRIPDTKKA